MGHCGYVTVRGAAATPLRVFQVLLVLQINNSLISMGGFFGGEVARMLCPPPIFSDFFLQAFEGYRLSSDIVQLSEGCSCVVGMERYCSRPIVFSVPSFLIV